MEATSTLADALLDDLDDLSDVEEESPPEKELLGAADNTQNDDTSGSGGGAREAGQEAATAAGSSSAESSTAARFLNNPLLQEHLASIRGSPPSGKASTKEEREQEHRMIVQSNKYLSLLVEELTRVHRDELCEAYRPKFPELEDILPNPVQYTKAVRVIGNEMDMTKVNDGLLQFLNNNQILTVSVSASTTAGRPLTTTELTKINVIATDIERNLQIQEELTQFVQSRMEGLAPSICALIGPTVAARLIGLAGGLEELSRIPACNLQVLGQVRQNRAGMSSTSNKPHQGILAECDLVRQCRGGDFQRKALKVVAAKLALAARCDFINVNTGRPRSAASGAKFRTEIETKFEKWKEPDKAPTLKALPKPDLTTKKRRGGKRMRRLKERFEETAMMKQANTRAFSAQSGEYGDDAMGITMGLLDTAEVSAGGNLRKTTEKRKMKYANTKASRKRAAQMSAKSASSSGLASSMVFTPAQGMELVNPDANKERVKQANQKWFGDTAGFQSALPKK